MGLADLPAVPTQPSGAFTDRGQGLVDAWLVVMPVPPQLADRSLCLGRHGRLEFPQGGVGPFPTRYRVVGTVAELLLAGCVLLADRERGFHALPL